MKVSFSLNGPSSSNEEEDLFTNTAYHSNKSTRVDHFNLLLSPAEYLVEVISVFKILELK